MDYKIDKKKDAHVVVTVTVDNAEKVSAETRALADIAKHVHIKGFREGKAPAHLVRERVTDEQLLEETVRQLLPTMIKEALAKSEAKPILRPTINVAKKDPLTVAVTFVERPTVTIKKYESIAVEKKPVDTLPASEIDAFIKKLLSQDRTETPVERTAKNGDLVRVALKTTEKDGKPVPELTVGNYSLTLGNEELIPELESHVTGLKKDDVKKVEISFDKEHDIHSLRNKKLSVEITVKNVAELQYPELTAEYLKSKLQTEKTPEQFRSDVKDMLLAQKKDAEMKRREEELYEKVKSATSVTLPEELIDAEAQDILRDFVERLKEQNVTLDQWMKQQKKEPQKLLDEMRDIAKSRATLRLGMQELAKLLTIEPTEADMTAQIDALKVEAKKTGRTLEADELTPGGSIYESVKFDATMRLLVERMVGKE